MKKEDQVVPGMPDFAQLKRIAFRAETTSLVKRLRGFAKGHSIPDRASASADKFVGRIAADDVRADIEHVYQALREAYGYRRNQIEASSDEGSGVIRTPCFVYSIGVGIDPVKADAVLWRREVTSLRDPLIVRSQEFTSVFKMLFQSLVFEFETEIAVAELVDQIEEESRHGVKVLCGSDASWCDIILKGFRGAIHINARSLTISGRHGPSAASLLDQFLFFIEHLPRSRDRSGPK
jgi:hypothetical protein